MLQENWYLGYILSDRAEGTGMILLDTIFIYLFSHLADAFIQSDLQSKPTKEQHTTAITSPG